MSAKDCVLSRLMEDLREANLLNPIFDILVWLIVFYMRQFAGFDGKWDIFYLPFLVVAGIDLFRRTKCLKYIFVKMGNQSTNIWLIHSFFCYYFYATAKVVTATKYAVPSLITLAILSYMASVAVNLFWKVIGTIILIVKKPNKLEETD